MKLRARTLVMLTAAVAAAGLLHQLEAAAQAPVVKPGDELRPLYAKPEDIADGKQFALSSCAGCHGPDGISTTSGVPNLAGQRPSYLYLELKAYQSGGRTNAAMNTSVRFVSDDALLKVAAYYASLDPAQPPPGPAPTFFDPVQAGKAAAAACAGCHGETGVSKTPVMPSLVGLYPQYLAAAMEAYRSGHRKNDIMKPMLATANDADISHIALFYALQKPARAQTSASGDPQAGKAVAVGCAGCHGDQGVSGTPSTPSLAGQDPQYLMAALRAYKNGDRADDTMKALAASVPDSAMNDMAAYYAALEPQAPNVRAPLSTEEWAQRCDRCHGINGNSTDPRIPALAGQRIECLQEALRNYRTHARANPEMAAMAGVLSDDEVKNLATYYSHQKARAALFIAMPNKP